MIESPGARRERTVAFVVARLTSSRLVAKHFQLVGGRPLIEWTLEGLRQSKEIDEVVIATVAEHENEPLRTLAEEEGLECFWYEGDVNHVTTRLRRAAEAFGAEICLLISGDCPLMHGPCIDELLRQFRASSDAGCMQVSALEDGRVPALEGVMMARSWAWKLADDLSDRPELKEHQFPKIWLEPERFSLVQGRLPDWAYFTHHRFSIDTQADLDFMRHLHAELTAQSRPFDLPAVLELLRRHPDLLDINRHVHQRRLVEQVKKVLCVADSGGPYGYGHLMRSLELACQITERLSWPVTFLTDDPRAVRLLASMGIHPLHGAIGRTAGGDLVPVDVRGGFDLCLLDLARRPIDQNWRSHLPTDAALVALDSLADWAAGTDLVIIPGVTGPPDVATHGRAAVVQGVDRLILRREIRQIASQGIEKDLDVLCYAHSDERQERVEILCAQRGWSLEVVRGARDDFARLLARSRVFLSNFGYSFYEALALSSRPVAWPLTEEHQRDALTFFERLGLPAAVAGADEDLMPLIERALNEPGQGRAIADGTFRIVADIQALLCPSELEPS